MAFCPLLALSGHTDCAQQCPLLGVKRTSRFQSLMSAFDPKRTSDWVHLPALPEC